MKLNSEEHKDQIQSVNNFFNFDNFHKISERIESNYKRLSEVEATYNNLARNYSCNDTLAKIALLEEKIRTIYARKCISIVSRNNDNETSNNDRHSTITPESNESSLIKRKAELLRKLEEAELTIKMLTNKPW